MKFCFLFIVLALTLLFFVSNVSALTINCDKQVYNNGFKLAAYCNITNMDAVNINFTAQYPNTIYNVESIAMHENTSHLATVSDFGNVTLFSTAGSVSAINSTAINFTSGVSSNITSTIVAKNTQNQPNCFPMCYDNYNSTHYWVNNWQTIGSHQELQYFNDWINKSFTKQMTNNNFIYKLGNISAPAQLRITFNIPPNTVGKFNLTVDANGSSFTTDPTFDSTGWQFKVPLNVTENTGIARTNYIFSINVTIPSGHISNCTKEIRVTQLDVEIATSGNEFEVPSFVADGDDSSFCFIEFVGNVSKNSWRMFNVYYGNPNAQQPIYDYSKGNYFINLFNFTGTFGTTVPINDTHYLVYVPGVLQITNSTHVLASHSISAFPNFNIGLFSINQSYYYIVEDYGCCIRTVSSLIVNPDLSIIRTPLAVTFNVQPQNGWLKNNIFATTEHWVALLRIFNFNSVIASRSTDFFVHTMSTILFNSTSPFLTYHTAWAHSCFGFPCDQADTFPYVVFNGTANNIFHFGREFGMPAGFSSYSFLAMEPTSFEKVFAGGHGGRLFVITNAGQYIKIPTAPLGVACEKTDAQLTIFDSSASSPSFCFINSIKKWGNSLELLWANINPFIMPHPTNSTVIRWNMNNNQTANYAVFNGRSDIFPAFSWSNNMVTERYNSGFRPSTFYWDGQTGYSVVRTQKISAGVEQTIAPPLPDLSIKEIKPVQVVFDVDINNDTRIDLVKGKNTSIIVDLNIVNPNLIQDNQDIDFLTSLDGIIVRLDTFKYSLIKSQGNQARIFFVPSFDGNAEIAVTVDPLNLINESNETNNLRLKSVSVKDTNSLRLAYFPVNFGSLNLTKYNETANKSGEFVQSTYPIAENGLQNVVFQQFFNTSNNFDLDLIRLCQLGRRSAFVPIIGPIIFPAFDRTIGVVSKEYAQTFFGNESTTGQSFPLIAPCAAMVQVDTWHAVAHEIGHTFGLPVGLPFSQTEEYKTVDNTVVFDGRLASGFYVNGNQFVPEGKFLFNLFNRTCFMGTSNIRSKSLFSLLNDSQFFTSRWVDKEDYTALFNKFKTNIFDPDTLLVSGIIFKNRTVVLDNWYEIPNGTVDILTPGNFSIQLFNVNGTLLNNVSFNPDFLLYREPQGPIEVNFTPFIFSIPFPNNTLDIKVMENNTTLVEVRPTTKLLEDTIKLLPNFSFINSPNQRRDALLNKVDAIDKMLAINNTFGAKQKLQFDIRDKIQKWIVDFSPETSLQLNKTEIITLIDNIVSKFG